MGTGVLLRGSQQHLPYQIVFLATRKEHDNKIPEDKQVSMSPFFNMYSPQSSNMLNYSNNVDCIVVICQKQVYFAMQKLMKLAVRVES